MDVYIPYRPENPKTRLSPILEPSERATFSHAMLNDVVAAVEAIGHDPRILATAPVDGPFETVVSTASLSDAVNNMLAERVDDGAEAAADAGVAVVMADLALATPAALERLFAPEADVVVVPGRRGGTNALVVRSPAFRVDYHGASFRDHRAIAEQADLELATVDSFRLATDVDEPIDLVEVLLHGDGRAREYLDGTVELNADGDGVSVGRADRENAFVSQ